MAAGLGFKDFVTGEVLTAADVDGYLMQGVWVFASAAARDAAVTSPQEGNFAYLKDTNTTTYYTGSAWTNLVSSSAAGSTLLSTQAISAVSSISAAANTFSSTYDNYQVLLKITTFVGQDQTLRFRTSGTDNTTSNYRYSWIGVDTGGTTRTGYDTGATSALLTRGNSTHQGIMSVTLDIFSPFKTEKTTATGQAWGSDGAPSSFAWSGGIAFNDTTSFDSFTLTFPGSTTGTMSIYGLAK